MLAQVHWRLCESHRLHRHHNIQHLKCNAIHVFEGSDDEGQLCVRREWASNGPDLCTLKVAHTLASNLPSTRHAFCPPSPNELDNVARTAVDRAVLGT
jgi:hypothetical protein